MSRKSQAFAQGQPAFSWKIESIPGGRFQATCKNHPNVKAVADTEQKAIRAAQKAMDKAIETAEVGMKGPGSC